MKRRTIVALFAGAAFAVGRAVMVIDRVRSRWIAFRFILWLDALNLKGEVK